MKGILNSAQIEYLLFHLGQHINLHEALMNSFVFVQLDSDLSCYRNKIIFSLSDKALEITDIKYINTLPVLFPLSGENSFFSQKNGSIIFTHDILKSAFYLLSGYQEVNNKSTDSLGRYSYKSSIQSILGITAKPVVNYYFEEIISGIEVFCNQQRIEFRRKSLFSNFAFFLTHDVDRIKYYNVNTFLYLIKTLFKKRKGRKRRLLIAGEIFVTVYHILNIFDKKDPYWNFGEMSETEKNMGITSAFYFLPKDRKHVDSYYNISDKKILDLIRFLQKEGHEIGLHGTVSSSVSLDSLKSILSDFLRITNVSETGIRQHRLMWNHPGTALNHYKCGAVYDTTLGFAEHEGFRNSYCHPFKFFDFGKNCTLPYWEIPLNIMDSTLFHYRRLGISEAMISSEKIITEVIRFNGIFTLLWHNSFFDEKEYPGITGFYTSLLQRIIDSEPEILTGLKIIKRYTEKLSNE